MRIILSGYTGKMGQIVLDTFKEKADIVACVAIDADETEHCYKNFDDITEQADVVVDFSHHANTAPLIAYSVDKKLPVVICTTGQTEEEKQMIHDASKKIPVFFSANMSLGIAVLADLVKKATIMFPDADIEIVETHHNRKIDVPSGTALLIADEIKSVRPDAVYNIGRQGGKRQKNEIGIASLRMGNEVGTHEIFIHTETECITLKHNAYNRAVFADGAYQAAQFIMEQKPGHYTMKEMLEES